MYYKGAECAIITYDVTNRDSFEQMQQYWVGEVELQMGRNSCFIIAGNKADLINERVVSEEEGKAYAHSRGASYFETSAKTDLNITEMFHDIAGRLPSNDSQPAFDRKNTYSLAATPEPSSSSKVFDFCC